MLTLVLNEIRLVSKL